MSNPRAVLIRTTGALHDALESQKRSDHNRSHRCAPFSLLLPTTKPCQFLRRRHNGKIIGWRAYSRSVTDRGRPAAPEVTSEQHRGAGVRCPSTTIHRERYPAGVGATRRVTVPLLGLLDRAGRTRRLDDFHRLIVDPARPF